MLPHILVRKKIEFPRYHQLESTQSRLIFYKANTSELELKHYSTLEYQLKTAKT